MGKASQSYRDLRVYQQAHELGVNLHRFSLKLPKYELYETGSQLRRASKSISANIVEGYGRRRYQHDYIRFLTFASSSCLESGEWLTYIHDLYDDRVQEALLYMERIDHLGRSLHNLKEQVVKGRAC